MLSFLVVIVNYSSLVILLLLFIHFLISNYFDVQPFELERMDKETKAKKIYCKFEKSIKIVINEIKNIILNLIDYIKNDKVLRCSLIIVILLKLNIISLTFELIGFLFGFISSFDFIKVWIQLLVVIQELLPTIIKIPLQIYILLIIFLICRKWIKDSDKEIIHQQMILKLLVKNEFGSTNFIVGKPGAGKDLLGTELTIIAESTLRYDLQQLLIEIRKEFPEFPFSSFEHHIQDLIKKHIKMAKDENADIIIASMHWGTEYRTTANEEQKELSDFLFQNGVNIIIGNHPHVIEPFETREVTMPDGTTKQCFVAYALGNFTADQNAINTRDSIILNMKITRKVDGTICIDNINYVPIYMYKNTSVSTHKFKLIDLNSEIETYENGTNKSISNTTYNLFKKELSTIEEESSVIAEFTPKSENDYTIKCRVIEKNETIFEVRTFAGSRERAKKIVDNWNKNASKIYPKILNLLLEDED